MKFLLSICRHLKKICLLEGARIPPLCYFRTRNISKKMSMEHFWNDTDRVKPKYWGKTRPIVTLSATIRTLTDVESKMDHCVQKPLTNGLSHSSAIYRLSPYWPVNITLLGYKNQLVNVV
jgi:hypothetical protein